MVILDSDTGIRVPYVPVSVTISRTKIDSLKVIDSALVATSGIKLRTLSDSISVLDDESVLVLKQYLESIGIVDTDAIVRTVNRVLSDSITASDDRIVSRSAIFNSKTISEALSIIDRSTANRIEHVQVSAKILHGIEVS